MVARFIGATALVGWAVVSVACGGSALKPGRDAGDTAVVLPDSGLSEVAPETSRPPDSGAGVDSVVDAAGVDAVLDAVPDSTTTAVDSADGPTDTTPDQSPIREAGVDVPGTSCPVDCEHLPHVKPGTALCSNGHCAFLGQPCEDGFAHCSNDPNDGCEAALSSPLSCGSCTTRCFSPYSACEPNNDTYVCSRVCVAPLPDSCDSECVDFQNDVNSCGGCGVSCYVPNALPNCVLGQCTVGKCNADRADCTSDPGCETTLGTIDSCAGCGDKACSIANALFSCSSSASCATALCAPGFGNCDPSAPDCETSFDSGGACLPTYLGTSSIASSSSFFNLAVAIGADGSYFMGGEFANTVDFDPTDGVDLHTAADDQDAYITKLNADGSYAWTRTLAGRGIATVNGLAGASDGAIVAVGGYGDSIDLDPGTGVDFHETATQSTSDGYVVKLAADGSFVWGRTFAAADPTSSDDAKGVALDANDSVYAVGGYQGTVDFDPSAATALHTSAQGTGMVVKLTSAGAFSWAAALDDMNCLAILRKIAIASDGALWTVGMVISGPGCVHSNAPTSSSAALIAAFEPAGNLRGTWTVGGLDGDAGGADGGGVAAAANGAIYVSGTASNVVDLDPGPKVAMHLVGGPNGGFILKLAGDASLLWAHTIVAGNLFSIASTADGGVLGLGPWPGSFVTKVNGDGSGAWSFVSGNDWTSPAGIAARGHAFALVGGHSLVAADFDPGPNTDIISGGDVAFLSRFSF